MTIDVDIANGFNTATQIKGIPQRWTPLGK